MITKEQLIDLGFKDFPYPTIGHMMTFKSMSKHKKTRVITIGSVNTPNEMITIGELNSDNSCGDLIVIHNYDYDGYITLEKLSLLIDFFKK